MPAAKKNMKTSVSKASSSTLATPPPKIRLVKKAGVLKISLSKANEIYRK
jgi:hypothetical protein